MRRHLAILILLAACGEVDNHGTTPLATLDGGEEESTGAPPDDPCKPFVACAKRCKDDGCIEQCAAIADADAVSCTLAHCESLAIACGNGLEERCDELLTFCIEMGTSSGSESSGSEGSSSSETSGSTGAEPDPCDAYLGCINAGGTAEQCAALASADPATCEAQRCDELAAACGDGDAQACADWLACIETGTSSGGESSSDGTESGSTSI